MNFMGGFSIYLNIRADKKYKMGEVNNSISRTNISDTLSFPRYSTGRPITIEKNGTCTRYVE